MSTFSATANHTGYYAGGMGMVMGIFKPPRKTKVERAPAWKAATIPKRLIDCRAMLAVYGCLSEAGSQRILKRIVKLALKQTEQP